MTDSKIASVPNPRTRSHHAWSGSWTEDGVESSSSGNPSPRLVAGAHPARRADSVARRSGSGSARAPAAALGAPARDIGAVRSVASRAASGDGLHLRTAGLRALG